MTDFGLYCRRLGVARGDRCLAEARAFLALVDATGHLPTWVWWDYWQLLNISSNAYEAAGLSLLAGRVAFMARRVAELGDRENVRDMWAKFDRLNAGECGVA